MTEKPENPPAFPSEEEFDGTVDGDGILTTAHTVTHDGMSLRDWLAGQAMYSLSMDSRDTMEPDSVAEWCYSVADACLVEREKPR